MAYITQSEFLMAISPSTAIAIFDDNNDGALDTATLDAFIARASSMVDSWLASTYREAFPVILAPVPAMIRELTLQYTIYYVYERHPEYTRTLGENQEQRWKRVDTLGERLQKATLRIVELAKPANVGVRQSMFGQAVLPGDETRIFDNMGRFNR